MLKHAGMEAFDLILLSLVPLSVAITLAVISDRRGTLGKPSTMTKERWQEAAAPGGEGPYALIREHPYLMATAGMTLIFSWVVASGDNILFGFVQSLLKEEFAAHAVDQLTYNQLINTATTAFYGNLYFWINLIGLVLQAFIVSRILRFAGFGMLMLTTPIISLAAYASMLATPLLAVVKAVKIAENASNYSVNNTARHILWLPTSKEMLYQAKPTVDTLFVRLGDGLAALTVLLGTRVWAFDIIDFVSWNIVLVLIWLGFATYLVREHRIWSHRAET